jgi:endonuclease YncB( thermonuclease family)
MAAHCTEFFARVLPFSLILVATANPAEAACSFEIQGEGRVAAVIDGRSFRLDDGREVRLAGIEPVDKSKGTAALAALVADREVTLRGDDDTPGRIPRP